MRTSSARSQSSYLSAVAIFRDEAHNLDEWLAFHVSEGIERILLYDNRSTDNPREVLQPWIGAGVVELIDWPVPWKSRAQDKAYLDALQRLRGRTRWAAFIDLDEFLFSPTGRTVAEVLKRYEEHPGVVVNWQCYGTSGHKTRPAGLTIESFTRRAKTGWARNRRVKTIVDPSRAVEPWGPHLFKVEPSLALVTEDFKPVGLVQFTKWRRRFRHLTARLPYMPFDPYSVRTASPKQISVAYLRINHYATRSEMETRLKYKGRSTMREDDRRSHSRYHDRNEVEDPILVSQAGLVREIIGRVRTDAAVGLGEWAMTARQHHVFDSMRTIVRYTAPQPSLMHRLDESARLIRRNVLVLWLAARDRRIPWYAKVVVAVTGVYPLWPFDFIPDVVPILGYVDDLAVITFGILVATRLIAAPVMADLRLQASRM